MIYEVTMSQLEASVLFDMTGVKFVPSTQGLNLIQVSSIGGMYFEEAQLKRDGYIEMQFRSDGAHITINEEIAAILQTFNEMKFALDLKLSYKTGQQNAICIASEHYAVVYTVPEPNKITFTRMSLASDLQLFLDEHIVVMDSPPGQGIKIPIEITAFEKAMELTNKAIANSQIEKGISSLEQIMPATMAKGFYNLYAGSFDLLEMKFLIREKDFTTELLIFQSPEAKYQIQGEQFTNYEIMPAATAEVRATIDRLLRPMIECLPQ